MLLNKWSRRRYVDGIGNALSQKNPTRTLHLARLPETGNRKRCGYHCPRYCASLHCRSIKKYRFLKATTCSLKPEKSNKKRCEYHHSRCYASLRCTALLRIVSFCGTTPLFS